MYGLIVKISAVPGKRDDLISILLGGSAQMPGCLNYIVAKDVNGPDTIWITEVWDDKSSHDASLSLLSVKNSIAKGRPLIAGFASPIVTAPVGGVGLLKGR
jgi:quinol monooxygenase YgiN